MFAACAVTFLMAFSEVNVGAGVPFDFNTPVYELKCSNFILEGGNVSNWVDPENNGAWTGSWNTESFALWNISDTWSLSIWGVHWQNTLDPVHQFDRDITYIRAGPKIDITLGNLSIIALPTWDGAWISVSLPLSPSFSLGYETQILSDLKTTGLTLTYNF